jgi:6,7-dimethyl-8-ribityllumazine synthase
MEESAMPAVACGRLRLVRPDSGSNLDEETMNQPVGHHTASPSDAPRAERPDRFAFVQSCWHRAIVDQGREGFLAEMARQGVPPSAIDLFEVPGAFEIPLLAKRIARSGRYAAIIACGLVVDGGIYRHEFVADAVISALMAVQLETDVPVISAVLTPQQFHEHQDHQRFFAAHFVIKGTEAASACLQTVTNMRRVR